MLPGPSSGRDEATYGSPYPSLPAAMAPPRHYRSLSGRWQAQTRKGHRSAGHARRSPQPVGLLAGGSVTTPARAARSLSRNELPGTRLRLSPDAKMLSRELIGSEDVLRTHGQQLSQLLVHEERDPGLPRQKWTRKRRRRCGRGPPANLTGVRPTAGKPRRPAGPPSAAAIFRINARGSQGAL